ncbi:ATP-binding protein [Roseobacter ponti]|uniref:histidine kinase n=1 Tax=Roseobacter ponti TaxID=1891787 RepID=A0A858STJ7_9RHOB|nr:ATP-binding protein [Roseobacter ponti]QJF51033.1 PAS domain-containing protein [Roseobacter ponti]
MQTVLQILENVLLLALMGVGYYAVESLRNGMKATAVALCHGLSFGLIAFLVTATPVSMGDGATLDARAGPVILAGYVGGPVAALITAAFGVLARGMVGGSFAFSGMVVFGLYAAIGIGFRIAAGRAQPDFLNPRTVVLMCMSSCIAAAAMFFLIEPRARAFLWLQEDLPFIFFANTIAVAFASCILGIAASVLRNAQDAEDLNSTLQLAKRAGQFGIWDFDIRSGRLTWDDRSKELHGVACNDFSGTFDDWVRSVHPDDIGRARDTFFHALKDSDSVESEYRVCHADGTVKSLRGDALILRDKNGAAIRAVGTNLDLTDIRTAEQQLKEAQLIAIQAQKFDTIGQLTGGVAHDFNNLLAVIMGNLELIADEIRRSDPDRDELQSLLDASLEATRRGADLTRNMLAYARKARLDPVDLDLNEVVRQTESWMRRTIASKIEIETNLQAGLWLTRADKSSLQSALVNLLVNARDAFEGSGQVTIETANMRVDEDFISERHEDIAPGRYVMLAVSDNGSGIDPDIISNIFDPFFTTKGVGLGSGLGLSMVQGFVKQSGGAIRVYSEPGVGTSFKLYFAASPGSNPAADVALRGTSHDTVASDGRARLLLVEDREEVLLILRKTLEGVGYTVETATSGDEGLQRFREDGAFDLVVTDIVMPGELQGPTMAREIRKIDPEMRFIFLSGYASEATVNGNGLKPSDIRLMKPVSRKDLIEAVQKCLVL